MRLLAILLPGPLALALALGLATAGGLDIPWLLLGTRLEADATGRVFLLLAAVVWTTAGLALGPALREPGVRAGRLAAFGSVALAGNLGAAVAQDAASFYACFSAMSLATYGLIAARADRPGQRAGRLYIAMAVVAEAALLAGLVLAVRSSGSLALDDVRGAIAVAPDRDVIIALLLVGFGVKAGMLGLHIWLPLAYTAPPLPVAAVVAGALTELGVLGWLRVLPVGEAPLAGWGVLLVAIGLAAVVHGVIVGATQRTGPAVLAYSSIGQIGLMLTGIGIGLARPETAPAALAAVLLLALHHGIVKSSLFLALGVGAAAGRRTAWRAARAVTILLALALAGAPLTSGEAAKESLKVAGAELWGGMEWALALSAAATALLMWRLLAITAPAPRDADRLPGRAAAGALALGAAATVCLPLLASRWGPLAGAEVVTPSAGSVLTALWPIVLGVAIGWAAGRMDALPARLHVPTGDVAVLAEATGRAGRRRARAVMRGAESALHSARSLGSRVDGAHLLGAVARIEGRLTVTGTGILALVAIVLVLAAVLR